MSKAPESSLEFTGYHGQCELRNDLATLTTAACALLAADAIVHAITDEGLNEEEIAIRKLSPKEAIEDVLQIYQDIVLRFKSESM